MVGFIFGGDTGVTPEQLARERQIADAMLARGMSGGSQNAWEGLGNIANAIAGRFKGAQVAKREAEGRKRGESAFREALEAAYGMGGVTPDPTLSGGTPPFNPSGGDPRPRGGSLIDALIQRESGGDPNAVSPAGAVGLTQIMPDTARDPGFGVSNIFDMARQSGVEVPDESDETLQALLRNPDVNTAFGQAYLGAMQGRYGQTPEALAAYNAGPGAVDQYGGVPPFDETQNYVSSFDPEVIQQAIDGAPRQVDVQPAPVAGTPPAAGLSVGGTGPQGVTPIVEALANPWLNDFQRQTLQQVLADRMKGPERLTPYQVAQLDLAERRFQAQQRGEGGFAPATTNIDLGQGDDKFADEQAKFLAGMYGGLAEQGVNAQGDLGRIGELERLMQGGDVGGSADALRAWAQETFGVNLGTEPKVEAFNALISQLVPAQRPPGSGQMSDRDLELFKAALPRLVNTPEGNRLILNTMRRMAEFKRAQGEIAREALVGRIGRAEALDRIYGLPDPLAEFRQAGGDDGMSEDRILEEFN